MTRPLSRRGALALGLAAIAAPFAAPGVLRAQTRPRVVVVGGGAGGATCARALAATGAVDVTLVEANPTYATCFFSNAYLGGLRSAESLVRGYDRLAAGGISVVTARAASLDAQARDLVLEDGSRAPYDALVLSPGVEVLYESVPGFSADAAAAMPVAWRGGSAVEDLRRRLDAVKNGETIVMIAPPNPYRCPPGPYERVSMMAHRLKSTERGDCRIVILDQKDRFSKQALFTEGWEKHYPGMIEWLPPEIHGGIERVDPAANTVETDLDAFEAALVTVIPRQRAGAIAQPFADDTGFCPVEPETMRALADPRIWVLGDSASAGDMPKSAFSANAQAKTAAMAIMAELADGPLLPARYANTCWSLLTPDDCVKVGAVFTPSEGKIASAASFVSQPGEDAALRRQNAVEAEAWYAAITAEMFG